MHGQRDFFIIPLRSSPQAGHAVIGERGARNLHWPDSGNLGEEGTEPPNRPFNPLACANSGTSRVCQFWQFPVRTEVFFPCIYP